MSHHISIPALSRPAEDGGSSKTAVVALCSPPSGRFVGHITRTRTAGASNGEGEIADDDGSTCHVSSEANLLRSAGLLPVPTPRCGGPGGNRPADDENGATVTASPASERGAAEPTAVACLDLSDRRCTGRRKGALRGFHDLTKALANVGKASTSSASLASSTRTQQQCGEHPFFFGADADADSALLAVGHADGSVSVRYLPGPPPESDGNMDAITGEHHLAHDESVMVRVASTEDCSEWRGGGSSPECSIAALAFLPASSPKKDRATQTSNDAAIQIVALTKGGRLVLLELCPRDETNDPGDGTESLAEGRGNDEKTIAPNVRLAIRSVGSVSTYSDSRTTGALSVGKTGNGVVYVAVGVEAGVLILRPTSQAALGDGKYAEDWNCVTCIDLPSSATSLAFSTVGTCVVGFGDAPVILCAGQADGEVALMDAAAASGLDETEADGGTPTFQPFYFIEPAELAVAANSSGNEEAFARTTSVACHRDWTKQGAGRILVAIASGSILRLVDGSAFEVIYHYDVGKHINDVAFALDKTGAPRVVVAKDDGETIFVGMRTWGLLLEGSQFLKLHEQFHPSSVSTPFVRRSSTGKLFSDELARCIQWGPENQLFEACGSEVLVYDSTSWNYDVPPHSSSVSPITSICFGDREMDQVRTISVSNDGGFISAAIEKKLGGFHLCIYKRPTRNENDGKKILPKHCQFASNITSLSYSPDSKFLCVATLCSCAVFAVDADEGISDEPVRSFDGGRDAASWSLDGKYLAVGKWSNVLITEASNGFEEVCSLDAGEEEEHRIKCLSFGPLTNQLLIGFSNDTFSFSEKDEYDSPSWTIVERVSHPSHITSVIHSPDPSSPFFVVLGLDENCYVYSKMSRSILQVIKAEGPLSSASFHPSGSMLALSGETAQQSERLRGDVLLVRVGEILNPCWYPLQSSHDDITSEEILKKLNCLSEIDRQQILYHNGSNGIWPLAIRIKAALEAQRKKKQMAKRGSARRGQLPPREEVTSILTDVLREFPRSAFATRGCNGKSAFDFAIEMDDPRLLRQLFYSSLVASRAHSHLMMSDDVRTGYLTRLLTVSSNEYPEVCMDVVHQMVLWPVPTLELLETWKVKGAQPIYEVGSSPTSQQIFNGSIQPFDYGALSRPMVLPLPGICSLPFLSAVVSKVPVEVFNHDVLGLILDELWFNGTRTIFLIDFACFMLLFASSSALFVLRAALTKAEDDYAEDDICTWESTDNQIIWLSLAVFTLNVLFGVRELRQLRSSGDDILTSFWGTVGGATQQLLEEGSTFLETKNRMRKWAGISNQLGEHVDDLWNAVDLLTWCMINAALAVILWSGPFVVEITVITSFLLLLKMLSYLRGFDDCGWLLVVLYAQFKGAQGFIVVIGTILLGFAVCFRVLLGQNNEDFATFGTSLFSMFDVGVLGDFDRSAFKDSANPILTMALFIILLVVVLIVAMSGFVLILESSLEDVRENEEANRKYQRARIIIDYMKLLSPQARARLLGQRKYFFALVPVDHEDAIGADVSKESFIRRKRMWRTTKVGS